MFYFVLALVIKITLSKKCTYVFLPKSKIKAAVRRWCTEVWEIAEVVDLPPEFVAQAIFSHENRYLP